MQPFRSLRLSWNARGELGTLTAVESDGPLHTFKGTALYSAFYLNELLLRLLARHDPHPGLYRAYQDGLQNIARGLELEPVLRVFEKRLLQEIGYELPLDYDIETGAPVQPQLYYDYQLESGPVMTGVEATQGFIFKGSSLLAFSQERLTQPMFSPQASPLKSPVLGSIVTPAVDGEKLIHPTFSAQA